MNVQKNITAQAMLETFASFLRLNSNKPIYRRVTINDCKLPLVFYAPCVCARDRLITGDRYRFSLLHADNRHGTKQGYVVRGFLIMPREPCPRRRFKDRSRPAFHAI